MCQATRDHLPSERIGFTHKFEIIAGQERYSFYMTCNIFEDGRLGEILIKAGKMGSLLSGVLDGFAINFSIALQHGVPLEALTTKMRYTRFKPDGAVNGAPPELPGCHDGLFYTKSLFDYIAAYLEWKFPEGRLRTDAIAASMSGEFEPVELTPGPVDPKDLVDKEQKSR